MVWKKVKQYTEEDAKSISSQAKEVKNRPLLIGSHTREVSELNRQQDCKITVEKKLTKSQSEAYNQILEEQRFKDDPLRAKPYKRKSAVTG